MGKFLVRLTVITVGVYFALAYILAQYFGLDILGDWYIVLFELICVVYCYSEGKYHCRYIKHLSLCVFLCEIITRLDNELDFLSVKAHNMIPLAILALGVATSVTLAIRHFYRVLKVKKITNDQRKPLPN